MPTWLIPFLGPLFEAVIECIKNRSKSKVRKGLRKPGRRERKAIAKVLRRDGGFRGRELWAKTYEAVNALETATDRQIDNFMACGVASNIEE